jgi:hypothetical protein
LAQSFLEKIFPIETDVTSIPFKGMVGNDLMLFLHGYTPAAPDSCASGSAPQAK